MFKSYRDRLDLIEGKGTGMLVEPTRVEESKQRRRKRRTLHELIIDLDKKKYRVVNSVKFTFAFRKAVHTYFDQNDIRVAPLGFLAHFFQEEIVSVSIEARNLLMMIRFKIGYVGKVYEWNRQPADLCRRYLAGESAESVSRDVC